MDEFGITYDQSVSLDNETLDVIKHVPRHERDGKVFQDTTEILNMAWVKSCFCNSCMTTNL